MKSDKMIKKSYLKFVRIANKISSIACGTMIQDHKTRHTILVYQKYQNKSDFLFYGNAKYNPLLTQTLQRSL